MQQNLMANEDPGARSILYDRPSTSLVSRWIMALLLWQLLNCVIFGVLQTWNLTVCFAVLLVGTIAGYAASLAVIAISLLTIIAGIAAVSSNVHGVNEIARDYWHNHQMSQGSVFTWPTIDKLLHDETSQPDIILRLAGIGVALLMIITAMITGLRAKKVFLRDRAANSLRDDQLFI